MVPFLMVPLVLLWHRIQSPLPQLKPGSWPAQERERMRPAFLRDCWLAWLEQLRPVHSMLWVAIPPGFQQVLAAVSLSAEPPLMKPPT